MINSILSTLVFLTIAFCTTPAEAAEFKPTGPMKIIIPYGPPSGVAKFFHILQNYATSKGITLVPEYKPGAEAMVGLNHAASGAHNVNNTAVVTVLSDTISKNPARKFNKDYFTPITAFVRPKMYIVAGPNVPVNNLSELFSTIKQNPGKLTWASSNEQIYLHIQGMAEEFGFNFNELVITRFNGGSSVGSIAGGHIDLGMYPAPAVAAMVNGGQLKLLGTYRHTDVPNRNVQSLDQLMKLRYNYEDAYSLFTLPGASPEFTKFWKDFTREFLADEAVKQQIKDSHFYQFDHGLTEIHRILKLWQPDAPIKLTQREEEIYNLIRVRGLSNRQIATQLSIGESAVKLHVSNVLKKHGLRTRTQLAVT